MKKNITVDETGHAASDDIVQMVSFFLGDGEFAVNILSVQEINRVVEVTRMPRSPDFVEGVIDLRGKVIPVICLRKRLGLPEKESDHFTRVLVVELDGQVVGFTVDGVHEVLRIRRDIVEEPPAIAAGVNSDYISGVAKRENRLLIFLDLDKVLSAGEVGDLKQAA